MQKFAKIIAIILGAIVVGIGILAFIYAQDIKPDQGEKEKSKVQAMQYVEDYFNEH